MSKTILLKLSGEALKSNNDVFDLKKVESICNQIKKIVKLKHKLAIVVGGGNIFRGAYLEKKGFDRCKSDYVGMMATVVNATFIKTVLNSINVKAEVFTTLAIEGCKKFDQDEVKTALKNNTVSIFACGVGHPYFSTDSLCALRSLQIDADLILFAKNGVDGVYDSDPKINKNAKFIKKITYKEIIENRLSVIDLTASILLENSKIEAILFDMAKKDNILNAINKTCKHTQILGGK